MPYLNTLDYDKEILLSGSYWKIWFKVRNLMIELLPTGKLIY